MTDHGKALEAAARAVAGRAGAVWSQDANRYRGYAQAAVAAFLAQREADGFVMVPVEPTEVMVKAGVQLAFRIRLSPEYSWQDYMTDLHRAMLAARPKAKQ